MLISVYHYPDAPRILYELLAERRPHESISHKAMPSYDRHCAFVESRPYAAWYLIADGGDIVGSVYLTRLDEIGCHIFERFRRAGYGFGAIEQIMRQHPRRRFLANINPQNEASQKVFRAHGFRLIQQTYELETTHDDDEDR